MAKKIILKENPRAKANLFSVISFWWLNGIFRRKKNESLTNSDLYKVLKSDSSIVLSSRLQKEWSKELNNSNGKAPSLARAIWKTFRFPWLILVFPTLIKESLRVLSPLCVGQLLRYFEGYSSQREALQYSGFIVVIVILLAVIHHLLFYDLQKLGWHARVATTALMYQKTLKLSQKSLSSTSTGKIVNLASTDVLRYDLLSIFLHHIWVAPLQACVVVFLMWQQIGYSSILGLVAIIVTTFFQTMIGKQAGKIRAKLCLVTDKRIRMMNEILSSIRVVKMYNWESSFHSVIAKLRKSEVIYLLRCVTFKAINFSFIFISSQIISIAVFISYVLLGGRLTPSLVFTTMGLFQILRTTLAVFFPTAIERLIECRISTKRIEDFLILNENEKDEAESTSSDDSFIHLNKVSCKWINEKAAQFVLKDISLEISSKQLIGVVGPTGAGKSSLLLSILRELPIKSGDLQLSGRISYASQVPWIFYGSIKENILFGDEFDSERYEEVISACGLVKDFSILPNGDLTFIGEKGVTLSGGQKARINLARAVYRKNCDIILLDDPLSALDATVARDIFKDCICNLLSDKTRVLVTHQITFLKNVDQIAVLKQGELIALDNYEELFIKRSDLNELITSYDKEEMTSSVEVFPLIKSMSTRSLVAGLEEDIDETQLLLSQNDEEIDQSQQLSNGINKRFSVHNSGKEMKTEEEVHLVGSINSIHLETESLHEEEMSGGKVKAGVYWQYIGWNPSCFILLFIFVLLNHSSLFFADWWIGNWATESLRFYANESDVVISNVTTTAGSLLQFNDDFYIYIYLIIFGCCSLFMISRSVFQFRYCISSGIKLHDDMLLAILNSSVRFFDVNPIGRILNRFSKDLSFVDDLLPLTFMDFTYLGTYVLIVLTVACTVNYFTLIVVIPLMICFIFLRQYYIRTSRDVKRLEGANRSPVFSHLSNTLDGLITIRSFKMEEQFLKSFHKKQDLHSASWYMFIVTSRWFAQRLDGIIAIFIASVAYLSVLTSSIGENNPGNIGLALNYSFVLINLFQWCVRQSAEVENLMTSVERLKEYADIDPEVKPSKYKLVVAEDWASDGRIEFNNLHFSHYPEGPEVLRGISFVIEPREKIGIVGRTGAGKSSLIAALYRFNYFNSGEILIDDVDISKLKLTDLRSALSIIPQDPRLFYGTIRFNMDPFSIYTDEDLWLSLEKVQLKERVSKYELKLETVVSEGGSNFSVGERQLFCLARAMLRKAKILMIDEATANVDQKTDQLIQEALRVSSKQCTVLTIAHRINTVIDCDKVLVMDSGKVVEFGEPYQLIMKHKNEGINSPFFEIISSYNEVEVKRLVEVARKAHIIRSNPDFGED